MDGLEEGARLQHTVPRRCCVLLLPSRDTAKFSLQNLCSEIFLFKNTEFFANEEEEERRAKQHVPHASGFISPLSDASLAPLSHQIILFVLR
jgi:hypothetical protein